MQLKIKAPSTNESRIIKFMILLGIFSILNFLIFFFQPEHVGNVPLYVLLTITILYSVLKKLYMWYNYSNISVPEIPESKKDFKVDILTTYFPGEPYQMTITTLEAINEITYPHTTYLCDEADDPYLKEFCAANGIVHVTRDNRKDAKAGNINNALKKHATGDICVVLDPDHIPEPNFLDPILPHFENPEIGFVQIVQSYYNTKETLVARGAAEQTFQFYGPMMMTLNSYGAVNAIGANCVFRREALDSIGGHAPGLCEDMHTAMLMYSKGWKAVYLPEVLAKGLAPSNLTNFFKQQLKWSRGSFDLLVKVYPKIFHKLTGRQKIHFGILPMHYLGGVITLINFLIPILSLLFSTTPWKGNIIDFFLVLIPVAASSLLIRTFIQKWVIEKKERGFHLVGGLLHINTWWIYIVGLVYTLIDKKVPYLPTPKENEWNTNYKIIIPNAIVAVISIIAVVYGLRQDFTPYSLVMAGFAIFNAGIMLFGIYLTHKVANQNRILRTSLGKTKISFLWKTKEQVKKVANGTFNVTRKVALPLLLLLLITSMNFKNINDRYKWENVTSPDFTKISNNYLGIFHPYQQSGLSDIQEINYIENQENVNFDIVSLYLAWDAEGVENFPDELMHSIYEKNAFPMITWEPWIGEFANADSPEDISANRNVFKHITNGYFDDYIREFIQTLKGYDKAVFLRFAHEFDNPQYPWSHSGHNSPEEFKNAWKHVHNIIKAENAHKIILVWNPWKAENFMKYYPGDEYVDWVSFTLLNYGALNEDGENYSYNELYRSFKKELKNIENKPVMLAEFGSVDIEQVQGNWTKDAMKSLRSQHDEISAVVLFNSAFDKNIPKNDWYENSFIDWTSNSIQVIRDNLENRPVEKQISLQNINDPEIADNPITSYNIRGINYMKGKDWKNNYYALTKDVISNDLEEIKNFGINTIQYTGSGIYDYNLLKYTAEHDLHVIYGFEVIKPIDFINDEETKEKMKENILSKVKRFKQESHVIAYSFDYNLENFYTKPLLFDQRTAYLNWLNSLIREMRTIDNSKSLVLNLNVNDETIFTIQQIKNTLPVDSYGLIVKDTNRLPEILDFAKKEDVSVYISSLLPEDYLEKEDHIGDMDIVLSNWQDQRYSNRISFDGLLDHNGNKRQIAGKIKNAWSESPDKIEDISVKILKPSELLYPGQTTRYSAVLNSNDEWLVGSKAGKNFNFEWNLVKLDDYGNPMAIKKLGSGPEIKVKIPENYKNYELLLITKNNDSGYSISTRSSLHTPIENK